MKSDLKARIAQMQQKLSQGHAVQAVHADTQLFVTRDDVCQKMVALAGIQAGDRVLEPSAGTGSILRAIQSAAPGICCDCVELNAALAAQLQANFPAVTVTCGDFLSYEPGRLYQRIIMNPPFRQGTDLKHISRALSLLSPGGRLVAICTGGPRQHRALVPRATHYEELPRGTFSYTDVASLLVCIDA
ncbi:class I SAM-dependent methyltransferase [Pantoea sp. S61]|uniref:methyltransferase n=1 Tax=Pantoea sp. S61 TaxID=2767442 RepID=UPI00190CF110|nr:class I SAM-dependent methyltransferase [Pantoea sp. S61]MBK0127397.1 class I SAM-dependent methyltransferase [Pantoea sp. S61]